MRFSFEKIGRVIMSMRKVLGVAIMVSLLAIAMPSIDFASTAHAQTKTTPSKKKKGSSSTTQKKQSVAGSQKKSSQSQKKTSSQSKKPTTATQKKTTQKNANQGRRRSSNGQGKNSVGPTSSTEAKRLQEATQREIQQTKEKLRLNEQEIKTGLSDLNRLSSEIATGKNKVAGLQNKVTTLNQEITHLGEEISKNEAELQLMREEYLKAVKKMRLTKKNQSTLAFIFASENFNQAMRRIRYMRQFSEWKARKSADIDHKIEQLSDERTKLAKTKETQTVALGQLQKSQQQLEENRVKQEQLVATLRKNGDVLQAHLVAKQNEANRLKETISALIAQEQAKAEAERKAREKAEAERIAREKAEAERKAREKAEAERIAKEKAEAEKRVAEKAQEEKETSDRKFAEAKANAEEKVRKEQEKLDKKKSKNSDKSSRNHRDRGLKNKVEVREKIESKEALKTADPIAVTTPKSVEKTEVAKAVNFAGLRGKLPRPVEGNWRITNPFGRHSMPEMPEIEYDNPGIDAEVAKGTTVKAVCGGKVSGVYKLAGYGNVVIVNHGDYYTVYGNLASTNVTVGTQVAGGHALGTAGADPDDQRHGSVHFEVWKGREKQNPSSWLR